jgi:hypothetical protein
MRQDNRRRGRRYRTPGRGWRPWSKLDYREKGGIDQRLVGLAFGAETNVSVPDSLFRGWRSRRRGRLRRRRGGRFDARRLTGRLPRPDIGFVGDTRFFSASAAGDQDQAHQRPCAGLHEPGPKIHRPSKRGSRKRENKPQAEAALARSPPADPAEQARSSSSVAVAEIRLSERYHP